MLIQLDVSDRVEKLDETVDNVEDGYEDLLAGFAVREEALQAREEEATELAESRSALVQDEASENPNGTLGRDQRVKRKFTVLDDDDEDEEGEGEPAKRPKA